MQYKLQVEEIKKINVEKIKMNVNPIENEKTRNMNVNYYWAKEIDQKMQLKI